MPDLVAVEGASGTGKSTIAVNLARRLGFRYLRTPPEPLRNIRDEFEDTCTAEASLLFNLVGVRVCSDAFRKGGVGAIVDRYYLSSFIYARAQALAEQANAIVQLFDLVPPSAVIVLETKDSVRRQRLKDRQDARTAFRDRVDSVTSAVFRQRLPHIYSGNVLFIDSTGNDIDAITENILRKMRL